MSKLLYSATMSLDGFIAGPAGDMSWLAEHLSESKADVPGVMAEIGSLLIGRTTYGGDDPNAGTDKEGAFGGMWSGPQIVLTHDLEMESPSDDITICHELGEAVATAREAAGKKYVNVLGADIARQCIERGVLDEVLVFIAPVLLGDGTRLFDRPGGARVELEPLAGAESKQPSGLWFSVVR